MYSILSTRFICIFFFLYLFVCAIILIRIRQRNTQAQRARHENILVTRLLSRSASVLGSARYIYQPRTQQVVLGNKNVENTCFGVQK